MAVYVEDRYLNSQDSDFVNLVNADLQRFLDSDGEKTNQVLMFPPVSPYHRFLIHKTVEDFPALCSFSVGEGDDRRSVICLQELVLRNVLSVDTEAATKDEAAEKVAEQSHMSEGCIGDNTCSSSVNSSSQKPDKNETCMKSVANGHLQNLDSTPSDKRDDMPEVMQMSTSMSQTDDDNMCANTEGDSDGSTQHSAVTAVQSSIDEQAAAVQLPPCEKCNSSDAETQSSPAASDYSEHRTDAGADKNLEQTECSSSDEHRNLLQNKGPALSLQHDSHDSKDNSGTKLGSGAYLDLSPALMNELSMAVGSVHIVQPTVDYENYLCQETDTHSEEDYGRLIEICEFPEGMITRDLLVLFREFKDKHFDIRWVDKTHAIGIFTNQEIAEHVIASFKHPSVKVCPLHLASAQTKQAARRSRDILEPYKPRPDTSASTARNLVHGALGLRRPSSKERTKEHTKEHKRHSEKSDGHRHSSSKSKRRVWDGKLRPCAMDME